MCFTHQTVLIIIVWANHTDNVFTAISLTHDDATLHLCGRDIIKTPYKHFGIIMVPFGATYKGIPQTCICVPQSCEVWSSTIAVKTWRWALSNAYSEPSSKVCHDSSRIVRQSTFPHGTPFVNLVTGSVLRSTRGVFDD